MKLFKKIDEKVNHKEDEEKKEVKEVKEGLKEVKKALETSSDD